jgi:hypothetical protein
MKTLNQITNEANKLYMKLNIGNFFDMYHDYMYSLLGELHGLDDDELDYANEILNKCKAIIKAQSILNNVNIK